MKDMIINECPGFYDFKKTIPAKCKFYEFLVLGIKKLIRDSRITKP